MENSAAGTVRLVKRISEAGAASRRAAADLVLAGRITVNGTVVREPGFPTRPEDRVSLDGKELAPPRKYYIMLNKPPGWTCSNADPHADRLAVDLIRLAEPVRLFSAGRLDRDSEGLILFSNDGDFVQRLTHPGGGIRKRYFVTTAKPLSPAAIDRLTTGIRDDGEMLRAIAIEKQSAGYLFTLGEGKKREIRRMVAAAGSRVKILRRIAIGALELGPLPPGKWRELSPAECDAALRME
ncbi:MAG: rRNA pseudouridine synthase [Lentisphaeria bacterium]|nr:rRNA pseudouridine synthase [Lentisphaeria bacterium]